MRNTKTEYTSSQRTPVVLPEMEQLLPPLSAEQFSSLERDILENGCYTPIIVNEDLAIVDGHNRFRTCEKHSLPFRMLVFSFHDLLEAKQWALETQRGRRNLSLWELGQIALKLKPELETAAKACQGHRTDLLVNSSEGHTPVDTRKEMARAVGIGEQTMGRITRLSECQRQFEIVRKRRRNFVIFRRGGNRISYFLAEKECSRYCKYELFVFHFYRSFLLRLL